MVASVAAIVLALIAIALAICALVTMVTTRNQLIALKQESENILRNTKNQVKQLSETITQLQEKQNFDQKMLLSQIINMQEISKQHEMKINELIQNNTMEEVIATDITDTSFLNYSRRHSQQISNIYKILERMQGSVNYLNNTSHEKMEKLQVVIESQNTSVNLLYAILDNQNTKLVQLEHSMNTSKIAPIASPDISRVEFELLHERINKTENQVLEILEKNLCLKDNTTMNMMDKINKTIMEEFILINHTMTNELDQFLTDHDDLKSKLERFEDKLKSILGQLNDLQLGLGLVKENLLGFNNRVETMEQLLNISSESAEENCTYTDCSELYKADYRTSTVYTIHPLNSSAFQVYCKMEDGGWTILMNRFDGSQDFKHNWTQYKTGFGDLNQEFWLGNDHLHELTRQKNYTLKVVYVVRSTNLTYYAKYATFKVANETQGYKLDVGGYAGNGSNGLYGHPGAGFTHDNMMFSTVDRDNDRHREVSCATLNGGGGFWYNRCYGSLATGPYHGKVYPCMDWYFPTCTSIQVWMIQPTL